MAYQINKTDETVVAIVQDGQIDQESTDLTFIGKNFSGFGELLNENFIKLLENFANTVRPPNPVRGQLWYDTSELKLKIYTGSTFSTISSASISNTQPLGLGIGDLWYNNQDKQLFFYDGEQSTLISPAYTQSQGKSGVQVESILDTLSQPKVVTSIYTNGVLIGIFSKDKFIPRSPIVGFSENEQGQLVDKEILPGFNIGSFSIRDVDSNTGLATVVPLTIRATTENSKKLGGIDSASYLRADQTNTVNAGFEIQSDAGLVVGTDRLTSFTVDNGDLVITNNKNNGNIQLITRKDGNLDTAIEVKTFSRTIDLYSTSSDSQVNIGGALTVNGDLVVNGSTTIISTATITVEDKVVELAVPSAGNPSDVSADQGGIILKGDTDKVIIWAKDNDPNYPAMPLKSHAWNFSEHINIQDNRFLFIDGKQIIRSAGNGKFALTDEVIAVDGVTSIGKQTSFTVGPGDVNDPAFLKLENNRITTLQQNQDLELAPNRDVVLINSPKIAGMADPTAPQDAATKEYVDNTVETRNIVLSLVLTPDKTNIWIINQVLNNIAPVSEYRNGTIARIFCTRFVNKPETVTPVVTTSSSNFVTSTENGTTAQAITSVNAEQLTVPAQQIEIVSTEIQMRVFVLNHGEWSWNSTQTFQ